MWKHQQILRAVIQGAASLSLAAAIYIGIDLYRGLVEGSFSLLRGAPVTHEDGFRFTLIAFGEGLAVVSMLGCAALMVKVHSVVCRH